MMSAGVPGVCKRTAIGASWDLGQRGRLVAIFLLSTHTGIWGSNALPHFPDSRAAKCSDHKHSIYGAMTVRVRASHACHDVCGVTWGDARDSDVADGLKADLQSFSLGLACPSFWVSSISYTVIQWADKNLEKAWSSLGGCVAGVGGPRGCVACGPWSWGWGSPGCV
ncbi:hypothetical protein VTI74DRAFT_7857 [Chaetomium olivicolor]